MRQRLSWDKEKVADLEKQADPYTMNQKRTNPPAGEYQTGSPSAWAEDPNMKTPWKSEGRTETGHPAPVREAVVAARKMEGKALQCVTIAQRMLPGADDDMIEKQAMDLMYLPETSVISTLQRQASLAQKLAGEEKAEKEEKKEEVVEAKKEEKPEEKKEEEVIEAKKEEKPEEKKEEVVEAKKEEKIPEEKKEEVIEAKKEEKIPEEKKEEMIEASKDLLDVIFDNAVEASETPKTGAKTLSGIVKQASAGSDLDSLWDAPPDVSRVFK